VREQRGASADADPFTAEEMIDPNVRRAIFETLQHLMTHGDRCVIPAIGRLTEDYVSARRRPDGFFRGMGRMLSELTCPELALLQRFAATVGALELKDNEASLDYWTKDVPVPVVRCVIQRPGDEKPGWHPIGEFGDIQRLFHLLKIHELGKEGRAGGYGASSGPHRIELDVVAVRHIARIVGAPQF